MRLGRTLGSFLGLALVALASASAWAQSVTGSASDYQVTQQTLTANYETEPSSAATISFSSLDDAVTAVPLSFTFPFFGTNYSGNVNVVTNGWVSFTSTGDSYGNATFPTTVNGAVLYGYMEDLYITTVKYWTTGTAPNRHMVFSWTYRSYSGTTGANMLMQIQIYETTGAIKYSYGLGSGGSWGAYNGVLIGIQGTASAQWVCPSDGTLGNTGTFLGQPPHDYTFAPPVIQVSGTVTYDRYIVNASGIGNQSEANLPLANIRVEQRDAAGGVLGFGYTNASGVYNFQGKKDATINNGTIVVTAAGLASNVRPSAAGALYSYTLASGQSFATDIAVGTININETKDPGGSLRAPINIARSIQQVYDGAKQLTAKAILPLEVVYNTSISATTYTAKNGLVAASMAVSGASSNPDPWDASVIRKTYARHVLGNVAADPGTSYNSSFNASSDDFNAFAEGFGYYVNAAVSGEQIFYDGIDKQTVATTINLESPSASVLSAAPSSAVAGWVATALYDLFDAANENWDTIDGTGLVGFRPFTVVQSLSAPVSVATFTAAWNSTKGYDAVGLVRNFIHHGLIADDGDEPNDTNPEARALTQFGFIRKNRVLSAFNEDWYTFLMPDPTNQLSVSAVFDRVKYSTTTLTLEVRNSAGAVVLVGTPSGTLGPVVALSGALPADTYRVRVAVTAGTPIDNYTLQAFSQLAFKSGAFQPWTVGRPINVPVDIKGGIPPYVLTVLEPFKKPDGLVLDGVNLLVGGIPTGPQAAPIPPGGSYTYGFILSAQDAATPSNTASGPINFTVNDTLKSRIGEFLAVPYNKPLGREAPYAGGTAPYTATVDEGLMPHGVSFAAGELTLVGNADVPGSYPVQITAKDIALSAATSQTTGVCCTPFGSTTPLALGASACGFYFDAVKGSTVAIAVRTAPKSAKRLLRASVLDTDGTTVLETNAKGGKGKAAVKFVAPSTGRFYFVLASDTGDASSLIGNGKVAPTKSGSGENPDPNFVSGKLYTVNFGALEGAKLTFVATPDKSGLALTVLKYLIDPNGNIVSIDPKINPDVRIVEKNGSVTVKATLPTSETENLSGTWKLIVSAYPGPQGHFKYSFRVAEPKGGAYSFD